MKVQWHFIGTDPLTHSICSAQPPITTEVTAAAMMSTKAMVLTMKRAFLLSM